MGAHTELDETTAVPAAGRQRCIAKPAHGGSQAESGQISDQFSDKSSDKTRRAASCA
jgi:hypothetical protein